MNNTEFSSVLKSKADFKDLTEWQGWNEDTMLRSVKQCIVRKNHFAYPMTPLKLAVASEIIRGTYAPRELSE